MPLEDPLVRAQLKEDAAARYEAARRQLARGLAEWADEIAAGDPEREASGALAARRAAVIEEGLRFFGPLRRFVRHEVERWVDESVVDHGEIAIDDVVAAIYLSAVDNADEAPSARAFYTWLRRIARRESRAAVLERATIQRREESFETPVATVGEWPDRIVRLIAILSDPNSPLPEDILERREERHALDTVMNRLPEHWREAFLLSAVDGWDDDEIGQAEGLPVEDVGRIVTATRAFLHDSLQSEIHPSVA
jgi:RNA polymerase sigma factor (sigma-70 family)